MSNLLLILLKTIVAALAGVVTSDQLKQIIDTAFDNVKQKVIDSPNRWDDTVVLPMLEALRAALSVPEET